MDPHIGPTSPVWQVMPSASGGAVGCASMLLKLPPLADPACETLTVEMEAGASTATHFGVPCSGCHRQPIAGARYRCVVCETFNLCSVRPGRSRTRGIFP